MSLRRLPLFSTLIVLIAVGIMIRLGFWQIDRLHQKEALLARYGSAGAMSAAVPWPRSANEAEVLLYRRSAVDCAQVTSLTTIAGQNADGGSGLAQIAECTLAGGGTARIVLGWSSAPDRPSWSGGRVTGVIAPGPRLVADPPLAGLKASRLPDPTGIPNNHLAYAVQWFLFAGVALVIYALAVRKRLKESKPQT
jgi:surfeit locus 1 family protein